MAYIFKGNLKGFLCDECFDNISDVKIRLYRPQSLDNITVQAVLAEKNTFRRLTNEEVEAKKNNLIAETITDKEGNFTFELSENNYNGQAFDLDFECGTPPAKIPIPKKTPIQFHITTIQPIWRGTDNVKTFAWSYSLPARVWCYILSLFDIWTICGRVVDCTTQKPVPKVEVHAFDSDLFVDDKMGSDVTDATGHFRIQFMGDAFRATIIPGWNIEFPSGPDVYFHITVPGVTPTVYLLKEPSNAANTIAGRKNIGSCLCVDLCVKLDDVPQTNVMPPSFRKVGNYSIATDFDTEGFTKVGKYAFTESLSLVGDLPNGGNSNKVEFRFRVINVNTSAEIPWVTLKNAFPAFQIGDLKKYNTALPLAYATYPYEHIPLTINPSTDSDSNGWMVAPHQNDLSDGGVGLFVPNSVLSVLDTTKLVEHFFDLTTPTVHVAGSAISAADKFAGPDHVFKIIFEAREAGTSSVTTTNTLSKIVIWNGKPEAAFRQRRHPSWAGDQPDLRGVCMLDIQELIGVGSGCNKIMTSLKILSSIYHPYLESASMSLTGPSGTTTIPMPAPSVSGEIVMSQVYTFAASDPACAYILDLSCGYRLTNGSAAGGGSYFNTDRMAFCKV
jgi:hypothetical protein